ncbi:F-box protein At3g07870-like [Bidens hawaiensis]|uniref:F-box protein At3g07870-like n=1 Tax=Bidens hawaiensis TaxID=980011 RepID=UPI00404A592F
MEPSHLQKSMEKAMTKIMQESVAEERRPRTMKVDRFTMLPDDIIEDILKRLPARDLRYRGKYVCKRWFNTINNQILLEHTSFIIQRSSGPHQARQVVVREVNEKLEFKQQDLEIPCRGRIKAWCNEFLLIADANRREYLYAYDLFTEKGMYLPNCSTSCGGHYTSKCGISLCYDGARRRYKVIHMFMGPPIQCHILVLAPEVVCILSNFAYWKKIEVPSNMGEGQYYWGDPVSVKGRYLHWDVHSSDHLVSMDTVKERFYQTRLPGLNDDRTRNQHSFVEMNGFLALVDKVSGNKANMWILKDLHNNKWEKSHSLNLSCHWYFSIHPQIDIPFPICSVVNKRHIIFKKPNQPKTMTSLLRYDLKTNLVETHLAERENVTMSTGYDDRYVVQFIAPTFPIVLPDRVRE